MKQCHYCQKELADNAVSCKYCGGWFTDDAEAKQKEIDKGQRIEQLFQPKKQKEEPAEEDTIYFSVSTKKFIIMSIVSCGYYELYWFFRNWAAVKSQEQKKISPFWHAVFSVLFCYSMFKRIMVSAAQKGYKTKNSHALLTVAYIVLVMTYKAPAPFDLISVLSFIPIIAVNNAARFVNFKLDPGYEEKKPLTKGEIAFIVIGLLFWVLIIIGIIFPEG